MTGIIDNFVAPVCKAHIDILYQDEHVMLINKPSGLLSLSGKNPLNKDSVHFRLKKDFDTATLLHRLDLGTSGIMLVALSKTVNAHLTKQFQARTVKKTYISLLFGHLSRESGKIEQPIAKDPMLFPRLKVCEQHGKPALTEYTVLARRQDPVSTLVRFTPITGRTHQLRIHSQCINHPILGCDLYGTEDSQKAANRLMLHAETIDFDHPITGERIHGVCPAPFVSASDEYSG